MYLQVRLIDASFVWTEPHSKRIKVKLTIQKEVISGAVLEQVFVVEYVVNHQMCTDCHRTEAKDFWKAVVQVRQKVSLLFHFSQFSGDARFIDCFGIGLGLIWALIFMFDFFF